VAGLCRSVTQAGRFGLSVADARAEINRLVDVVRHWRESFFACGVSAKDIDHVAPAFLPECFFFESLPEA
jgi:serine/threonine-protein kinase HipA